MGRILSLDLGKKRTGVAVTDPLQLIANGLATVSTRMVLDFLKDYVQREKVERIVVGFPRQTSGELSESMAYIRPVVARLKKALPEMPIEYVDERYTSVLAHQAMIDGGLRKKARMNKELVDEISATIILQTYMEMRRMKK